MKKRLIKTIILCFTLLWIAVAVFCEIQEPLYFLAVTNDHTEKIDCWEKEPGDYYVFLPSYADLSQCIIQSDWPVYIGQQKLTHGMSCGSLQLNEPYSLSGGFRKPASITFMKSENIPAMYIDTKSGRMDKIHKEKGLEESGSLRLYTDSGSLDYEGDLKSIKMRGNSTLFPPKKPYSLKLTQDGNLLGMGAAKKWILLANYYDPTHLRNKIVLDTARQVNLPYSPESQWVDLYLNGKYVGLYQLCERNEVHPQRVNLTENGSFLVSQEERDRLIEQDLLYFDTSPSEPNMAYRVHYAGMEIEEMAKIWSSIKNAVSDPIGIDPRTGKHWTELIDLDSWVRKYLLEEVFGNLDGGQISRFFFLDGDTQIVQAGPPWDYDLSMANPWAYMRMVEDDPQKIDFDILISNVFYVNCKPENWGSPYFSKLYENPIFYNRMLDIYQREFIPALNDLINNQFDEYTNIILPAAHMDQIRWRKSEVEPQLKKLHTYFSQRVDFFNEIWLDNREYVTVEANYCKQITTYAVFKGDTLPELPAAFGQEWCYADTGIPLDLSKPVYSDMEIKMMVPNSISPEEAVDGSWVDHEDSIPGEPISNDSESFHEEPLEEQEIFEEEEYTKVVPLKDMLPRLAWMTILVMLIVLDILRTKRSDSNKNAN